MPIKAEHDEKSTPVVYTIEKFYANDTSELCEESMNTLRRRKKPFEIISLPDIISSGFASAASKCS